MQPLEQQPDVMEIAKLWANDQYVSQDRLRYAVQQIKKMIAPGNDLPEGQIMWLSSLAAAMNREAARRDSLMRLRSEGITP